MENDAESWILGQVGTTFSHRQVQYALPWESVPGRQPGFLEQLFGGVGPLNALDSGDLFSLGTIPAVPEEPPAKKSRIQREATASDIAESSAGQGECDIFKKFIGKVPRKAWPIVQDMAKQAAIERWRILIADSYEGSKVGLQLLSLEGDPEKQCAILSDVFEVKAAGTLSSRAASMLLYSRWLKANATGIPVMPISEELAYRYVKDLAEENAPPTRAKRFVEAVAFAMGMIGLAGAREVLESKRISGAALKSTRRKRKTRKRDPFTVADVIALEEAAISLKGPNQIFAGFLCLLIHTRCRFSDAMGSTAPKLELDETQRGFLEAATIHTKTSNTDSKRHLLLPLTALSHGLSDKGWAQAWIAARTEQGLDLIKECLMPAPGPNGTWSSGRLTASEANVWLKELLAHIGRPVHDRDLGTHSCKATLLSMCAKANVPTEVRKLLGYHSTAKSVIEYSRDALSEPLEWLQWVVWSILSGDFDPDATRSGRWKKGKSLHVLRFGSTNDGGSVTPIPRS